MTTSGNDADQSPLSKGAMLAAWLTATPGRELSGTVQEVTDRNGHITSLGASHTYRVGPVLGQGGQAAVAAVTAPGTTPRGPLVARVELNPQDPREWRRRELLLFLAHLSRVTPATFPALIRVTESFVTYVHSSDLHGQPRFDAHTGNEPLWVDVMERCTTLADHLHATHPNGYDPIEGAKLAVPLLRTLGVLHDRYRLVHRDIDEGNVLVAPDATLRIADWGVVVPMSGSNPYTYTVTFGKRATMPPENRDGDQKVGHHTDAWQAGRLLGLILTGASPFLNDGTTLNSPRLTTLPRELRAVIEGLTNPHIGARLGTYDAANLLEQYIGYPITTPTRTPQPRRRKALIGVTALALIAGTGTIAALNWPDNDANAGSTPTSASTSPTVTPTVVEPVALTDANLTYPETPTVRWTTSLREMGDTRLWEALFANPEVPWELMELPVDASPVDAGDVWIMAAPPELVALDPVTGEQVWTYRPADGSLTRCAGDLVDGNLACAVTDAVLRRSAIVTLDVDSGLETNRFDLPYRFLSFEVAGSDVVTVTDMGAYSVSRYTADGAEVWTSELPYLPDDNFVCGECTEASVEVNTSLVGVWVLGQRFLLDIDNGALVFQSTDWSLFSSLTRDGAVFSSTWDEGTPQEVTLLGGDGATMTTLPDHVLLGSTVTNGDESMLLMRTDGQVVELDPETGATTPTGVSWPTSSDSGLPIARRIGDLLLLEGDETYAYDLRSPETPIWRSPGHTVALYSAIVSGDGTALYSVLDQSGSDPTRSVSLTASRVSDGAPLWSLPLGEYDDSSIGPRLGTAGGHLLIVDGPTMTVLEP